MSIISREELSAATQNVQAWQKFIQEHGSQLSEADFSNLDLQSLDFSGLDLENCLFENCTVENCFFARCNLYGADFRDGRLIQCDFSGSVISSGSFHEAEMTLCDFSGCEMTRVSLYETAFEACELSRCRGLSQHSIDQAVGDTSTSIPQTLDYPEHWLQSKEEKQEQAWLRKLSAFRGDDLLFCKFDGAWLGVKAFRDYEREEVRQALEHQQTQVRRAIDKKLLHNDCPSVYQALEDYYFSITSSAGEGKARWPRKLHEVEQITLGLEGNKLISQVAALRKEVETAFPEKIAELDHIISTHSLIATGLERWRAFLQGAGEAGITAESARVIADTALPIADFLEEAEDQVDIAIPQTIRVLRRLVDQPIETAKLGAYGIVRCVESIFSSVFVYVRRMATELGNELLAQLPKKAVKLLVTGLFGAGVYTIFQLFPHLATWITGGLNALKSLGVIGI